MDIKRWYYICDCQSYRDKCITRFVVYWLINNSLVDKHIPTNLTWNMILIIVSGFEAIHVFMSDVYHNCYYYYQSLHLFSYYNYVLSIVYQFLNLNLVMSDIFILSRYVLSQYLVS